MLVNIILSSFFGVDKQVKKRLLVDYLGDSFLDVWSYYADLYATANTLFINNTILEVSLPFVELFLLFFCLCLFLVEI